MTHGPMARWLVSLGLLTGLMLWLDPARIVDQLGTLAPAWLFLALAVSIAQTGLSAWRWRFTAHRLGLTLSPTRAMGDYYLAGFVNQILPGGVLGDAWRARRHARQSGRAGAAWRAVILERFSGQVAVIGLAVMAVVLYRPWRDAFAPALVGLGLAGALAGLVGAAMWPRLAQRADWVRQFGRDLDRALLAGRAWPLQLGSSVLIVLSYLLIFAAAARGIGLSLPVPQLMLLALPVLLAMLIPISVAGWGLREGAAGAVWLLSGMPPEQGVAASIAYGLVVLLASLPGAVVLVMPTSSKAHIHQ